jgi:hypothetical protein
VCVCIYIYIYAVFLALHKYLFVNYDMNECNINTQDFNHSHVKGRQAGTSTVVLHHPFHSIPTPFIVFVLFYYTIIDLITYCIVNILFYITTISFFFIMKICIVY